MAPGTDQRSGLSVVNHIQIGQTGTRQARSRQLSGQLYLRATTPRFPAGRWHGGAVIVPLADQTDCHDASEAESQSRPSPTNISAKQFNRKRSETLWVSHSASICTRRLTPGDYTVEGNFRTDIREVDLVSYMPTEIPAARHLGRSASKPAQEHKIIRQSALRDGSSYQRKRKIAGFIVALVITAVPAILAALIFLN